MSSGMGNPFEEGRLEFDQNPEAGPEAGMRQRLLIVAKNLVNIAEARGTEEISDAQEAA